MMTPDELAARSRRAVDAATEAGRGLGLDVTDPVVLYDVFSVVVHLAPAPVVVRVPTVLPRSLTAAAQRAQQERELAVTGWLAAQGHPVVAPSPLVPAAPVPHGGYSMTFWQLVAPDPTVEPTPSETGRRIARLHAALAPCPADLTFMVPLDESVPDMLDELEGRADLLDPSDLARARGEWESLAAVLTDRDALIARFPAATVRPIHGDAPSYNVLHTPDGALDADFEHVGLGPAEWDLAFCGPEVLDAYDAAAPRPVDRELVTVMGGAHGAAGRRLRAGAAAADAGRWNAPGAGELARHTRRRAVRTVPGGTGPAGPMSRTRSAGLPGDHRTTGRCTVTTTTGTQGAYAAVNGLQMYYEIHGRGRPLVLLHGGVLTLELSFGRILPALAEAHQVIAVELQGHGRTADIDRPPQPDFFADDVVALLDHLGIDRADLFGFSLGGLVATEVAVRYPERVDRLVLAATHFRADGYHPEIQDPRQDSPRLPTAADFAQMQAAYAAVAPDPGHFEAYLDKLQPMVTGFRGWSDDQLRSITAPTLLVVGDTDFVRLEHIVAVHDLLPDARLAVLPGCSHMDVVRRPELLPIVRPFLDR